jgi:bifunctional non-homologous end joining protein LigD
VKEKTSKGYQPDGESLSSYAPVAKETTGTVPMFLNVVTEDEINKLAKDSNYVFQKKYDGERRLAFKDESCYGGNRKGQKVSLPNEIIASLSAATDIAVDGEIIGTTLYVFDLLRLNGKDFKNQPLSKRVSALHEVKFGKNIVVAETAFSTKEKLEMLASLKEDGSEGIVAKEVNAKYSSGKAASGGPAFKYKFYKTATFKVSDLTKGKRSVQMAVLENGKFVDVGAVTIPPNHEVPKVGELIEVRYLYANKGGSVYQPTYLGPRTDLDDEDASVNQLEYKQEV